MRLRRQLLAKPRFLLLRPATSLVTVVAVEAARHGARVAPPLRFAQDAANGGGGGGGGGGHAHLVVLFRADGDGRTLSRPADWFRANSRPARS